MQNEEHQEDTSGQRDEGFPCCVAQFLCSVTRLETHPLPLLMLPSPYPVLACFQDIVRRGEIIDNDMEDEFYLRRLDAGLFILQHICYIMAEICNANVPQVGGLLLPGHLHAQKHCASCSPLTVGPQFQVG